MRQSLKGNLTLASDVKNEALSRKPGKVPVPRDRPVRSKHRPRLSTLPEPRKAAVEASEDTGYERVAKLRENAFSINALRPSSNSATTIRKVILQGGQYLPDLTAESLADELAAQCAEASNGNMERQEAILVSHAHTLDALFQNLTGQAYANMQNIDMAERLIRLAFRAQNQCRASVETLGYLKNPTMVFARQANMTTGPQQVNNHSVSARGRKKAVRNELMEVAHCERVDSGTASSPGHCNSQVATVGKLDRSQDRER